MKIVRANKIGSIDDYEVIEVDDPEPKTGEVLIAVHSCGMGYVDALVALGGYQVKPPVPFTPGLEISGQVSAIGPGVKRVRVGDRVMAKVFGGGLAESAIALEDRIWTLPAGVSHAEAAGFGTNYLTAYHGLLDRACLKPGEKLLVFGASGGVGTAAVQIGKLLGAEVIAAASTDEKRAYAKAHGADHVIDTDVEGWRERLKVVCGGKGPNIVFDPVCGPLLEPAFRSQVWGGRYLIVGFVGGPIPKLGVNLTLMKGAALVGVDVRQFVEFEKERADAHVAHLLQLAGKGMLKPAVGSRFPFADFKAAMHFASSGKGSGKTVVDVAERDPSEFRPS